MSRYMDIGTNATKVAEDASAGIKGFLGFNLSSILLIIVALGCVAILLAFAKTIKDVVSQ